MATATRKGKAKDLYFDLVLRFPLRPIRSDKELNAAVKMVDSLLDRKDLASEEEDYLEVLGDLIELYESEAHPIAPVSDVEMLRHLIEAKGVSQTEVSKATGIVRFHDFRGSQGQAFLEPEPHWQTVAVLQRVARRVRFLGRRVRAPCGPRAQPIRHRGFGGRFAAAGPPENASRRASLARGLVSSVLAGGNRSCVTGAAPGVCKCHLRMGHFRVGR